MANEKLKDEVSDSTDWLTTPLESFAPVDSALRCQVCKEFYKTPMITSCSHTFCSLCIRRCLANDGKCPACRAPEQEIKLRNNWVLEEIVDAFARARPGALEYIRRLPTSAKPRLSKRKATDALATDEQLPLKRTRSSSRINPAITMPSSSLEDGSMEGGDENYKPEENDGLVACPICQARMKEDRVSGHLDSGCLLSEPTFNSRKLYPKPEPISQPHANLNKPLAAVNYSLLKDNALRKKLNDQGLSAGGTRQLLERRYTEWVTLWNANCDSSRPRSKRDLLRELEAWERTTSNNTLSSGNMTNLGNKIRSKDFDGAEWQATHGDDFRDLIAKARAQRKTVVSLENPIIESATLAERPSSSISLPVSFINQKQESNTGTRSQYFQTGDMQETLVGTPIPISTTSNGPMYSSLYQVAPPSSQTISYVREQSSSKQPGAPTPTLRKTSLEESSGSIVDNIPNN